METSRKQSLDELKEHLSDQIQFLRASAGAFDRGANGEAKRLALAVRVLVHDTGRSKSLLGLLGLKEKPFLDTAERVDAHHMGSHAGLVMMALGAQGRDYVAMLDQASRSEWVPFDQWWHTPVFVDDHRAALTREDIVLTVADQDGGAHVDPALDELYARVAKDNALGWTHGGSGRPLANPVRPAIRQIAHEVLKTLVPGYACRSQHRALAYIGGVSVTPLGEADDGIPIVGRNAPCPCGSGKKYKRCHGK